jgi:carbamoyltransferase
MSLKTLHDTYALDVPGKLMGLSAYGELNRKWTDIIKDAMTAEWWEHRLNQNETWNNSNNPLLMMRESIDPCIQTTRYDHKLKNTKAFMLAKSAQVAFEESIIETIEREFLDKIESCDNNLLLSGGGALNVLANEAIKRKFPDVNVYIPPNCHDGGLSFGILYEHLKTTKKYDVTRSGPRIFDYQYVNAFNQLYAAKKVTTDDIAELLKEQKIIGMCIGNMEVGPRALGNRSILCDASNPKMRDTLNARVKFREWFRPFAPICRKEDAPKYFYSPNFDNMECMQFIADVLPEYQSELFSITHYDNTARLQVVTEESNAAIYDILTAFDGVLINTSFNVQGMPILNTFNEAFKVLQETGLDHIVIEYENEYWLF